MYTPKYVTAKELVYKDLYKLYEKKNQLYKLFYVFNPFVLMTADALRARYGAITINNWAYGGSMENRGLRKPDTSVGSELSAHKFGAALDCNFKDATAVEIRQDMEKYGCFEPGFRVNFTKEAECFRYIHRVEMTQGKKPISWFHFDIFNCYNADGSIMRLDV